MTKRPPDTEPGLSGSVVLILSIVCGCAVANTYFPQSLTALIAAGLHVDRSTAALIVTTAQLGYAAGIFLLVPLGDRLAHRRLTVTLLLATAAGLFVAGTAGSLPVLALASASIGLTTVVAQVVLPMAVGLVPASRQGRTAGQLMSGIMGGILLARAFGGLVGAWLGWRAPYLASGGLALVGAVVLVLVLPATEPSTRRRYLPLLGESVTLFRRLPALRRSCLYQALLFGAFSAAWTCVALLLTGRPYHLGTDAVGVLALVGAGSIFATPVAGRFIDRVGPDPVNLVCMLGAVLAAAALLAGGDGGVVGWAALGVGMLMLDVCVQSSSTASQSRVLSLIPGKRSRLNTAYMTCTFLGGAAGSWVGVLAFDAFGWSGVCGLIALAAGAALARHLVYRARDIAGSTALVAAGAGAGGTDRG